MADMTVSQTIYEQLGGGRFRMMTGANTFVSDTNSLSFRVPNAENKITLVKITLTPDDLYTVEFVNARRTANGYKNEVVATEAGVYFDALQDLFTNYTGLFTRFVQRMNPIRVAASR